MSARRFKRYAAYKDSGVEWLGEIPTQWEALKLKRVCSFAYGDSLASEVRVNGGFQVYGSNGPVGAHERANTIAPCLVIGRKGSFGKVTFSSNPVFAIDTTFFVDRRVTQADIRWLYYVLTNAHLDSATKDSAIPGLDREDAYARELCLCSPGEQRAIAAFLDRETVRIDALVAKKERLIELFQEQRTALITRAVTRGLDPNVPIKDSGVEWLGEIPGHWEVRRIAMAAVKITNGYVGPTRDILVNEGVRYLQSLHIKEGSIDFERRPYFVTPEWNHEHEKSVLDDGDVLVVQTGDIGQVAVVPKEFAGCNCHALIIIRLQRDLGIGEWLAQALQSDYGQGALTWSQTGALHPHLECGHVREIRVAWPPLDEQTVILRTLTGALGRVDAMTAKVRAAIERLKELRTALISAAVTGKIDVREEVA